MAVKKRRVQRRRVAVAPKECYFCREKLKPEYFRVSDLQKFVTDRGKIIGRERSGVCAIHQRRLTSAIKHARHLALMAFVVQE